MKNQICVEFYANVGYGELRSKPKGLTGFCSGSLKQEKKHTANASNVNLFRTFTSAIWGNPLS